MSTQSVSLAVVLTTILSFAASTDVPLPQFSWKSHVPSRVRAMTADETGYGAQNKFGLKDVGVRIAERAGGLALRDLAEPHSRHSAQVLSASVVRPASEKVTDDTATVDSGNSTNTMGSTQNKPNNTLIVKNGTQNSREELRGTAVEQGGLKGVSGSIKSIDGFVRIGQSKVLKEKVTAVGDIDGNGFVDFVVANPAADQKKGSVRLYLMKEKNGFLFSRELVPGKWGFKGPSLQQGDEYGSKVLRLPNEKDKDACILVVGAPGDNAKGQKKGAIYILGVDSHGNVIKNVKVSAETDDSLALQLDENEGFGADLGVTRDLNGDGDIELAVKSASGSTTVLFMDSHYNVRRGLKMHRNGNALSPVVVKERVPATSNKLDITKLDSLLIRASIPNQCFFNETHCACGMKSSDKGSASCLDVIDNDLTTGKARCVARDCAASYVCMCDGTELCKRVDNVGEVWFPEEDAGSGQVFCVKKNVTRSSNIVQVGARIPVAETADNLSTFNATHCRCSPKQELVAPYECLDFLRTIENVAVFCTSRDCNVGDDYACDGMGTSYCKREFVARTHFVNDGVLVSEPGVVYCHQVSSLVEIVTPIHVGSYIEYD